MREATIDRRRAARGWWIAACAALAACAPLPPAAPSQAIADVAPPVPPPVTVAAAGDVHGEGQIRAALEDGENPLAAVTPLLSDADVTVVNVETAVGERGTPAAKTYTFQAPPELWDILVAAGVDVVTLANNHALDYGPEALAETIAGARAAGLIVVGAGADAGEAYAPAVVDVDGHRVGIVGLSRVLPVLEWAASSQQPGLASAYDEDAAAAAVRDAAAVADSVVVVVHWGRELAACPDDNQLRLASTFAAAGADLVVGAHPHVLQGSEQVGDTLVAYSLGNFLWYTQRAETAPTGVLHASLGPEGVRAQLHPALIGGDGRPTPAAGEAADAALRRFAERSAGGGLCAFAR